jgi:glycosyltransferase involved in cell wall biosynthesis
MGYRNTTILYEPDAHYHHGFHEPMITYPPPHVSFLPGRIHFIFEKEMNADIKDKRSREVLMLGYMEGKADILFSPHTLLINKQPWIIDIEHVLWFFENEYIPEKDHTFIPFWKLNIAKYFLSSPYCKAILCRSKEAIKSVEKIFQDETTIVSKCIYFPPVQPKRIKHVHINTSSSLSLLFVVSSYANYYRKGGDIALTVFRTLKKRYPTLTLIYVGQLPPLSLWDRSNKIPGLIHMNNITHNDIIHKILPSIDILLFPSRLDTFGTIVLEAMSLGKSVVVTSGNHVFGMKDVVINGVNGFSVVHKDNQPTQHYADINIKEFIDKTEILIKSENIRYAFGVQSLKTINNKFSIDQQNKKLESIVKSI